MTNQALPLPDTLWLIDDLHLNQPHVIGTYILLGDEPALVDPGPSATLDNLEAGLSGRGLAFTDIRAILLTHIHLDHAGATGTLVSRYPHLHVYVHMRGAPHLIDPERLLRSATRIYGDAMGQLWGEFLAVPEQNITVLGGGETIRLGDRVLKVYDAPGHASHHVFYFEEQSGLAFTGDTAGIRLPGSDFVCPPTPPPDIDLAGWDRSLATLRAFGPRILLPTHFGPVHSPAEHIDQLQANLHEWAEAVRSDMQQGIHESSQIEHLRALLEAKLGPQATPEIKQRYRQAIPVEQCWQGLARYWSKQIEQAPTKT